MSSYDDWRASGPHEDMPSVDDSDCCSVARCPHRGAWRDDETGRWYCEEEHIDAWQRGLEPELARSAAE